MRIALFNQSQDPRLDEAFFTNLAQVLTKQTSDYAKLWQAANVVVFFAKDASEIEGDACPLVFRPKSTTPGVLGDHYTAGGRPIGEVLLEPILGNGGTLVDGSNSLSCTASHEMLEMIGDPYANWWFDMKDGRTEEALELCDRTEADSYVVDGVAVSNFLGPRAFGFGPGPYDQMGLLKTPEEIRPGGYAIRRVGGPTGTVSSTFASSYPSWRKNMKWRETSRMGRRISRMQNVVSVF